MAEKSRQAFFHHLSFIQRITHFPKTQTCRTLKISFNIHKFVIFDLLLFILTHCNSFLLVLIRCNSFLTCCDLFLTRCNSLQCKFDSLLYVFSCGLQISSKISSHRYAREELVWAHAQDAQVWYKSGRKALFSLDRSF